jgi:Heparinase II/III-like protein/Heparinase II/III N-terminus
MVGKISSVINLVRNMGWRYVSFRGRYELMLRSGLLKKRFPVASAFKQYVTLDQWKQQKVNFFFQDRASIPVPRNPTDEIRERFEQIKDGKLLLFNSLLADLGKDYDWVTNPDSGFHYDIQKHWTEIADLSKEAGDIKFVWEKSRFSYLYDIIRYDHHYNTDCAEMVFGDIQSWIKGNPVNCGPNYRCSQEMSLRVMNWTFALFYYRNSPFLTDDVFNQMQYAIYWHMDHVYKNIDFSRIAVRNNHAITETLGLYLAGLFFPSMPGADGWKEKGKAWFEEEIAYQVYADGTYLQFSMNYHRVVVQLMTWGIALSEKNGERFSDVVYRRAASSLLFLRTCMVDENGWLPNYGANDGALFFRLGSTHFRDYRPQLQALAGLLGLKTWVESFEDIDWYGIKKDHRDTVTVFDGMHSFIEGGYYIIREPDALTFIRCGSYRDRPSQADNLHMDIWYKGENVLIDAGSYKYNTDEPTLRYFNGTQSHNTVMLDDKDQMLKGGRFIWYYWSQCEYAEFPEDSEPYTFVGAVKVFSYIKDNIMHRRSVVKHKGRPVWEVRDEMIGAPQEMNVRQFWHMPARMTSKVTISAKDSGGAIIEPQVQDGWASSLYGQKEKTKECYFSAANKIIDTIIKVEADS